jgi:tRNA(Ile)-lysidine synthase
MAEAGPGLLIRPMLGVRRSTVLAYLEEIGAAYVTDSSNLGAANARSRLRSGLAPLIESEYAPGFATRLGEFADEMRAADDYLKGQARAELSHRRDGGKRLDLNGFASLHPALAAVLLREFVRDTVGDLRRMNRAHIEAMRKLCLDPLPSGACNLPNGWRMRREYDFAVIELARGSEEPFAAELTTEAITEVAASGFEFDLRVHELAGPFFDINPGRFHTGPMESVFDAEVTSGGLVVRSFREGDRIRPLGMDGSRKVQDVFTDRKLPRERRKSWPLIATSGGEIVWIPQMARSRVALVTGATRKVLSLSARVIAPASIAALPRI